MKLLLNQFLFLIIVLSSIKSVWANEALDIVTDLWPPYAYENNNKVVGTDVDVALAVFQKLGVTAKIRLLPWKRCLGLVKNQGADAILAASITEERKEFLYFPSEPISEGVTVFFKKTQNPISSIGLNNNRNLSVGAILGYEYCDELDNSRLLDNASRVLTLEQSFNMLLLGRIDLAVGAELVGFHKAQEMGISDQLTIVGSERYCAGGNYLAFAKKSGYEELALRFSEELTKFKTTDEYKQILGKYGKRQ